MRASRALNLNQRNIVKTPRHYAKTGRNVGENRVQPKDRQRCVEMAGTLRLKLALRKTTARCLVGAMVDIVERSALVLSTNQMAKTIPLIFDVLTDVEKDGAYQSRNAFQQVALSFVKELRQVAPQGKIVK